MMRAKEQQCKEVHIIMYQEKSDIPSMMSLVPVVVSSVVVSSHMMGKSSSGSATGISHPD